MDPGLSAFVRSLSPLSAVDRQTQVDSSRSDFRTKRDPYAELCNAESGRPPPMFLKLQARNDHGVELAAGAGEVANNTSERAERSEVG